MASMVGLLLILALLIHTNRVQNWLAGEATRRLSEMLKTEVSVRQVGFSLFNRLSVEGVLVRDRAKDTLLYAGALKFAITDWFFLKDEADIGYIGLDDATIRTHRRDSIWNYAFIIDALSSDTPPKKKDSTPAKPELHLQRVELNNVNYRERDEWYGRNLSASIGHFDLDADEINLQRKKLFVHEIELRQPSLTIYDYPGLRPPRPKKKYVPPPPSDGTLQWNTEDWDILIETIRLSDGFLKNDIKTERAPYAYFDDRHFEFSDIDATIRRLSWQKDTLTAELGLSTRERSGFSVTALQSDVTMHPEAMRFRNLELRTPHSRLTNAFTMRYRDFIDDMENFVDRVEIEGNFRNSTVSLKDIAHFAPELAGIDRTLRVSGDVRGIIPDLSGRNIDIRYGQRSYLKCDLSLQGLPYIEDTRMRFRIGELVTDYKEASELIPPIAGIGQPDLQTLGRVSFSGDFEGFADDFRVKGAVKTALGPLDLDASMTIPGTAPPTYAGTVGSTGLRLGSLLGIPALGAVSLNTRFKGSGFDASTAGSEIEATVKSVEYNGYAYRNITIGGRLEKGQFTGRAGIEDPNLEAELTGLVRLDGATPEYNFLAEVRRSGLRELGLTGKDMNLFGKVRMNLRGADIDEIEGDASVYDFAVETKEQIYVFENLNMLARRNPVGRSIEIWNGDLRIAMSGQFRIAELQNTFRSYLSKYYPVYFKAPEKVPANQVFHFKAELKNVDQYLTLLDPHLKGLDNSYLTTDIDAAGKTFLLDAVIPQVGYKDSEIRDFRLNGQGDMDTLRIRSTARVISINDSLDIPGAVLSVTSSKDISEISLNTNADRTNNSAQLSIAVQNLPDGLRMFFNPSEVVVNDKTWRIERNGMLTISRSFIDAEDIRIVNGQQEIQISSLPSEIGNSNDILISLRKVNLGDLLPYVLHEPKIEGITSGDITIEDPYGRLNVYLNAQTEQTRFEDDSIGIISLNGNWNNSTRKAGFFVNSSNRGYTFDVEGHIDMADSSNQRIDTEIDIGQVEVDILEKYLGDVFSEIKGSGIGKLSIRGPLKSPDITGTVRLKDAALTVDYTNCRYRLMDPVIVFKPGLIDFGNIRIRDAFNNEGVVSGQLAHRFFGRLSFNFSATSRRLQLLNTTKQDNNLFYGKAVGRVNFRFSGPENDMRLYMDGEPVDSSRISVLTSGGTKEKGEVDYIVWRQYGREMDEDSIRKSGLNLAIDMDLKANPLLRVDVILDELSGDIISAVGSGNLKIHTGTNEATTFNGRYNIERGNYNFNFQDIFKKPFTLEPGTGSFISWTGDPYDADINVNASFLAEKVSMASLFTDPNSPTVTGVSADILKEISDVLVQCRITGTLSQPNPSFQIVLPTYSPVRNNPTVDAKLKNINRDPLEASKQSTYLIVFKSFAPQAAIVASNLNAELFSNTVSGVINSILANSVQNFFYKIFGSAVDVNFNYSRMLTDISGARPGSAGTNYRENVSLQFIKSMLNDKLIITFGSDFNFSTGSRVVSGSQNFLFLPDVNVEYKITPDGKFRTSFFFRSNFDALSTSGRRDRTGGNISFRTEFDRLFGPGRK